MCVCVCVCVCLCCLFVFSSTISETGNYTTNNARGLNIQLHAHHLHNSNCWELIWPALSGGMDWWRMEWSFSRVRKIFFGGQNFQENAWNSAEKAILAKFQAPKFENSEPEKMQFHTPSHSMPPLDSLLLIVGSHGSHASTVQLFQKGTSQGLG